MRMRFLKFVWSLEFEVWSLIIGEGEGMDKVRDKVMEWWLVLMLLVSKL